jgi:pyruvate/2-oxoglutarate dehydrogenase complex dihydrolipoamide dehydrogenase (E3) component
MASSTDAGASYDLLVIGAGAAGSTIAFEASARGTKVALVERWKIGGTCLNAGCDPTKAMVRAAEVAHLARTAGRFGIDVSDVRVDWPAAMARVQAVIDEIRGGDAERNVRDAGIEPVLGSACFVSPHEVEVNGRRLRADRIAVCTGARPKLPDVPGLRESEAITNVEAVALPELPRRLTIVGGGVVACEFAQIFQRFGSEVTMLSRGRLLPREEPELAEALTAVLRREGVRVETGATLRRVERIDEGGMRVIAARDGDELLAEADEILLATGREPVVDDLALDRAGIEHGPDGIVVDACLQTTAANIWAAGDVVAGGFPFTHVADYQARIVVHNALSGMRPMEADNRTVPWAIFTDPELGHVGMTEAEAREKVGEVRTAVVPLKGLARAVVSDERDGMAKLVADAATGRLLGAHVLSARGGEMLGELALAIRLRLSVDAISATMHAYPTFSEAVYWAAYELARPHEHGLDLRRGMQATAGQHGA